MVFIQRGVEEFHRARDIIHPVLNKHNRISKLKFKQAPPFGPSVLIRVRYTELEQGSETLGSLIVLHLTVPHL